MDLYILVSRKYYYGLPIYIFMLIIMRLAVEKVFAAAKEPV